MFTVWNLFSCFAVMDVNTQKLNPFILKFCYCFQSSPRLTQLQHDNVTPGERWRVLAHGLDCWKGSKEQQWNRCRLRSTQQHLLFIVHKMLLILINNSIPDRQTDITYKPALSSDFIKFSPDMGPSCTMLMMSQAGLRIEEKMFVFCFE